MAFITFEGGEGTGKTTQVERVRARLESLGHSVLVTREPGGTSGAEAVREVLLSGKVRELGVHMEAILFAAARLDNVEFIIKPALASSNIVLCDRFTDSTRAYQGSAGADSDFLDALERAVTYDARPDLTLVFDLPPEDGLRRATSTGTPDRYESDELSTQQARRDIFLEIASNEPDRCVIVDASRPLDEVSANVDSIIDKFLGGISDE